MVLALDDDELEEEEEELEVVRSANLLFRSPSQLLHYVTMSLPFDYQDEEDEEEKKDIRGELTAFQKVVCLDHTFGHDCSLSCEDCMNGGRCQEGKSGCSCPVGWGGILCNERLLSATLLFYLPYSAESSWPGPIHVSPNWRHLVHE